MDGKCFNTCPHLCQVIERIFCTWFNNRSEKDQKKKKSFLDLNYGVFIHRSDVSRFIQADGNGFTITVLLKK